MILIANIVPDTSVLFRLVFGTHRERILITEKFREFENIKIDSVIRAEVGRTIFKTYFDLKEILVEMINATSDEILQRLNEEVSRRYRYKPQYHARLTTIISVIFDRIFSLGLDLRSISDFLFFNFELELYEFQKLMENWEFIKTLDCYQADWQMKLSTSSNTFNLILLTHCTEDYCHDRINIVKKIFYSHEILIKTLINNMELYCQLNNITSDKKLIQTLNLIKKIDSKDFKLDFGKKYCWNLGDFLISLLAETFTYIYTKNIGHFRVLLHFRNLDDKLIGFN